MDRLAVRTQADSRDRKWELYRELFPPQAGERMLDIGVSQHDDLPGENPFLRRYPHPEQLTAVGIDDLSGLRQRYPAITFVSADGRRLPFPARSFDLVFSFHALEHIPRPQEAIAEMRRVLNPQGGVWIGTPNRTRVVGYLGSRDASLRDKLTWNLIDWWARARGSSATNSERMRGSRRTSCARCSSRGSIVVEDDTPAYYALLYPRHRGLQASLARIGLDRYAYPSIYFAGSRPRATAQ
jgi:SAM-dependent methyltransferase